MLMTDHYELWSPALPDSELTFQAQVTINRPAPRNAVFGT
jgi:hypothetical protein